MDTGNNIKYLLSPKSIALLGCSEKNVAGTTLLNLQKNGYDGKLYPVHPKNESVFGLKCYKSLADIPGEVDACVVGLRNTLVLGAIEEMHEKGVKAAVFFASGFAETGSAGKALEKQVSEKLAEYGIAACGPNCLGFINTYAGVTLYSAACDLNDIKGPMGLVSHSGSICIAFTSAARGDGFSLIVSCGNEAGLSVPDYFRAMIEDDKTEVIVGFLEAIRDPEGLKEVARLAVEKNKPIILLKVGKSEIAQKTAAAHSGALASSTNVTDAFFKQNNILQAKSFDEINEACELLLRLKDQPVPDAFKVGMTAISGGQLGFCSDVAFEEGVEFGNISEKTSKRIGDALPDFATAKIPWTLRRRCSIRTLIRNACVRLPRMTISAWFWFVRTPRSACALMRSGFTGTLSRRSAKCATRSISPWWCSLRFPRGWSRNFLKHSPPRAYRCFKVPTRACTR